MIFLLFVMFIRILLQNSKSTRTFFFRLFCQAKNSKKHINIVCVCVCMFICIKLTANLSPKWPQNAKPKSDVKVTRSNTVHQMESQSHLYSQSISVIFKYDRSKKKTKQQQQHACPTILNEPNSDRFCITHFAATSFWKWNEIHISERAIGA